MLIVFLIRLLTIIKVFSFRKLFRITEGTAKQLLFFLEIHLPLIRIWLGGALHLAFEESICHQRFSGRRVNLTSFMLVELEALQQSLLFCLKGGLLLGAV